MPEFLIMTEAVHEQEGPKLTPKELNNQLYEFFEHLPPSLASVVDLTGVEPTREEGAASARLGKMIGKSMERLRNKEYNDAFLEKARSLLSLAPITQMFREYACSLLLHDLTFGIDKTRPYNNSIYWLLDLGKSGGGIFDPERAEALEREAYQKHMQLQLRFEQEEFLGVLTSFSLHDIPVINIKYCWRIDTWRKQFIQNYHDEP